MRRGFDVGTGVEASAEDVSGFAWDSLEEAVEPGAEAVDEMLLALADDGRVVPPVFLKTRACA
jgi:hypothetical protein